jgi:hypothetical protein
VLPVRVAAYHAHEWTHLRVAAKGEIPVGRACRRTVRMLWAAHIRLVGRRRPGVSFVAAIPVAIILNTFWRRS